MVHVHDGEFVRVRVPANLERSLQIALNGLHAPFFTDHKKTALAVVLRRGEWERVAQRFLGSEVETGFRLIAMQPHASDPAFASRVSRELGEYGLSAAVLPAFHHDHLLVPEAQTERCLEVIRRILPSTAG